MEVVDGIYWRSNHLEDFVVVDHKDGQSNAGYLLELPELLIKWWKFETNGWIWIWWRRLMEFIDPNTSETDHGYGGNGGDNLTSFNHRIC